MADSYGSQTSIAISKLPESSFGTIYDDATSDYDSILTRARILPMPDIRKSDDMGVVGRGSSSMYPSYSENEVMNPVGLEIQYTVNCNSFLKQLRRYMGKDMVSGDVTVVEATKAWKKIMYELDPDVSRQLPSSSIVYRNNGADFIHGGCVGSTLNISQQGSQDPQYTMAFMNGGKYLRVRDVDPGPFGTLPAVAAENRLKGAESRVQYTDPAGTLSLVTPNRRLKSISFSANNNLDVEDERAGLPRVGEVACPDKGWYKDYLLFGDRQVSAEMRVMLDDDMREWDAVISNSDITNFTWDMKGYCIPTTAVDTQFGLKLVIPYCGFRAPRGNEDSNKMVTDVTIFPMLPASPTHYGVYRFEATVGTSNALIT